MDQQVHRGRRLSAYARVDIHQHLLTPELADELRRRSRPPLLDGLTLHRDDHPPTTLGADHHDIDARAATLARDGCDRAIISLSSPWGIEHLPPEEAEPLLTAYHASALRLPKPFGAWAAAQVVEPDPDGLRRELDRGAVGLQLPATAMTAPKAVGRLGPLLEVLEERRRPLLVHPGPASQPTGAPQWWCPAVPFVQQLHAAWHAWAIAGRTTHPRIRVCFVALAGLAPLHFERLTARGGELPARSGQTFYETSSYGPYAVEQMAVMVGDDRVVHGSDRPYAVPKPQANDPWAHTIRACNTATLLDPLPRRDSPRTAHDAST